MGESGSRRRPRVVQVISNLEYGGAQRQVVELANHMSAESFDVHVCSLSDYVPLAADLRDRSHRLHIIHKYWKYDISVIPRLARLLRKMEADIVHSYLFDADIAVRLAGRLAGTPLVVNSERNTDYELEPRQLAAYRLTRSWVDMIVANSNAGARFHQRMLGHDPSRYRVVHNGVDMETFSPADRDAVRRELGIAHEERVIGMFASFKRQKNHPLLFSAAAQLLKRLPGVRLLFVGSQLYGGVHGSDRYQREIQGLIDRLGIHDRCLFLGNRTDVARLYSACDVTVLPSLFEGTPNAVLESMACGVPAVVTAVSDNAYIVPDGYAGFVVPLGDADILAERLHQLLTDDDRRQAMGRQARAWVQQEFSTARLAAKIADVYSAGLEQVRR